jgi:uroporphyrinogen-III synthase
MMKYKILSTKKLLPSLVEQVKQNNIEIEEQEFITIIPILKEEKLNEIIELAKAGKEYIVFTSAHAVNTVDKYLQETNVVSFIDWKIFCLSGQTKDAVLNASLLKNDIVDTADNAGELAKKILEHNVKEIIFFCGNKRRDELPVILNEVGVIVNEVIVYETIETPVFATDGFDGILFFSPGAVNSFFMMNKLEKKTVCFAIGQTTAKSIVDFTEDNKIIVSTSPNQESMLAVIQTYFSNEALQDVSPPLAG